MDLSRLMGAGALTCALLLAGCSGAATPPSGPASSGPASSGPASSGPASSGSASSGSAPAGSPSGASPTSTGLTATAGALGPARIGLPVAEFAAALGRSLTPVGDGATEGCWNRQLAGLSGIGLMVLDTVTGPVRRVDVDAPALRTAAGVGVGSTRAEVTAAYPGGVESSPHKYVPGAFYLTVHDGQYDLLFETDARGVVTRYRFGEPDPVSWVEGCS